MGMPEGTDMNPRGEQCEVLPTATLPMSAGPAGWSAWPTGVSLGIPMMSISHSDLMPIRAERSDAGLSQCETVIDIRQEFWRFSLSWCGELASLAPARVFGR
jgi:hypothetical protein